MKKYLLLALLMYPLTMAATAPIIKKLVWGTTTIEHDGEVTSYKDCMDSPTGAYSWNWSTTGTQHVPGIQIADLNCIIDEVDVVILSQGMKGVLKVHPDTLPYLKECKKEYHVLLSPQAVKLYNQLVKEGKKVGILIHSTC